MNGRLDQLEDLPCEKVSPEVYTYYLKALGTSPVSLAMVLYVLYQVKDRLTQLLNMTLIVNHMMDHQVQL